MEQLREAFNGSDSVTKGQLFSCEMDAKKTLFEWVDHLGQTSNEHIVFVSRLPHRRLLNQIDISKVETYWMTHRVGQAHVAPDLDELHALIHTRISNHHGILVIEGLEWLVTLHGEKTVLNYIRTLRDDLHRTQWTLILPIDPLAFNSIWLARFRREAPLMSYIHEQLEPTIELESMELVTDSIDTIPVTEEGLPALVMLNRLPKNGFTKQLLRKRILQWRRMGLDVSEVEPALYLDDHDGFELYASIESKVRTAVELERQIDSCSELLSASELTTAKFRIRQLTGFDQVKALIDAL
jgi:hypothetical protein